MDKDIKIMRLVTGEDIIAECEETEDGKWILHNPMVVICRNSMGQRVMMMAPWLPLELIELNSAMIYADDVITIMSPKQEMIEYYDNLVDETEKAQQEVSNKQMFENFEGEEKSGTEEEGVIEELRKEIEQRMLSSNNKVTIH
jgi:predicted transcriptional regulator